MSFDLNEHTHRRYNPLNDEWVLVSPHRTKRPWQGQVEKGHPDDRPEYDPGCYLCPGNERAGGEMNPDYQQTFVFDNDFAALVMDVPAGELNDGLLMASAEQGLCRVLCFSPKHNLTLPQMSIEAIRCVVDVWADQYAELGAMPAINYVQIFENKGATMGCSNPHPHGQIWGQHSIPNQPKKVGENLLAYFQQHQRSLLSDYVQQELEQKERIVAENDHFLAVVPFWATWPFETMIISQRHFGRITEMTEQERTAYAQLLQTVTQKYDRLFDTSFPYSAGIHQAPTDGQAHAEWHFHMHFYPPLLRSATVKKFMVGYEMLGESQRDISAESAAKRLAEL